MTDENNVEAAPEAAPKAKKPAKVKRKKQEASRIAYKDRHKIKMSGLDTDNYEYRIVNTDDGKYAGRVEQLKERGYDIAKEGEFADDSGIEAGAPAIRCWSAPGSSLLCRLLLRLLFSRIIFSPTSGLPLSKEPM